MRKLMVRIIGGLCIVIALVSFAKGSLFGLFIPSAGYNGFLLSMGILAFMAGELGPRTRRWFDFAFGIILVLLFLASVGSWFYGASDIYVGNVIFTGVASIFVLFAGYQVPDQMDPPLPGEHVELL